MASNTQSNYESASTAAENSKSNSNASKSTEIDIAGTVTADSLDLAYGTLNVQGVSGSNAVLNVGEFTNSSGSATTNIVNLGGYATINGTGDALDFTKATVNAEGLENEISAKVLTMGLTNVGTGTGDDFSSELILTYTKSLTLSNTVTVNSDGVLWLNNQTGKVSTFSSESGDIDASKITNSGTIALTGGDFSVKTISSSTAADNLAGSIYVDGVTLSVTDGSASATAEKIELGGTEMVTLNNGATLDLNAVTASSNLKVDVLTSSAADIVDQDNSSTAALRVYNESKVLVNGSALLGTTLAVSEKVVSGTASAAATWESGATKFDGTSYLVLTGYTGATSVDLAAAKSTVTALDAESANAIVRFSAGDGSTYLTVSAASATSTVSATAIDDVANLAVAGTVDATGSITDEDNGVTVTTEVTGAVVGTTDSATVSGASSAAPVLVVGDGSTDNTVSIIAADGAGFIASSATSSATTSADVIVNQSATVALSVQGSGTAAIDSVTGEGNLSVNTTIAANTTAAGTVSVNSIGVASVESAEGVTASNAAALNEVSVGTGILAVSGDAVVNNLTLKNSTATVNVGEELNINGNGGTITSENGQGSVTAADLTFGEVTDTENANEAYTIEATRVTATNLTLAAGTGSTTTSAQAGQLNVVSDEDGNIAELHVTGTTDLGGGTLFIDPSVVYINSQGFENGDSDTSTSNVTNGNIILGTGSALYLGTTSSNLDTYVTVSGSAAPYTLAFKNVTVNSRTLLSSASPTNLAFADGSVVIGSGYALEVNPNLSSTNTANNQPATGADTLLVTDGGVLVVNNAITFTNNAGTSGTAAASTLTLAPVGFYTTDSLVVDSTGTSSATATVTYNSGTGGTLLFTGASTASVTADSVDLTAATVAVTSGTAATITAASFGTTPLSQAALTAEGASFVIESTGSLTLDNNGSAAALGSTVTVVTAQGTDDGALTAGDQTLSDGTSTVTVAVSDATSATAISNAKAIASAEAALSASTVRTVTTSSNASYVSGTLSLGIVPK
ncbi:MAG: hypothetical protein IJ228_02940 [Succinivibrio sp.]|nr:hypothetical protein [Succinivibrio sp.]